MPHPSDSITISSWPHSPCDSLPGHHRAVQAIPPLPDGQQHWGQMVNFGLLSSALGKERAGLTPHVMPTRLSGPGCSLPFGARPGEKRSQGAGWRFPAGESHVSRSSPARPPHTAAARSPSQKPHIIPRTAISRCSPCTASCNHWSVYRSCACIRDRSHIVSTKNSRLIFRFRLRNCTRFSSRLRSLYGYASMALLCRFPLHLLAVLEESQNGLQYR